MIKSGGYDWWETDAGGEDVESGGGEKAWLSKKPCNPPVTPFRKVSETTRKKERKIGCSLFFRKNGILFSEKAHTHNMLSHKGSVVCRPFWIRCYNSGQASGVVESQNGGGFFPCPSVNTLGVGCWCVGRLLMGRWGVMWVSEGRGGEVGGEEGGEVVNITTSDAMPGKTIQ